MGLNLSGMTTETRNPRTMQLDQMSPLEIVTVMNEEDARVPLAIAKCLPQIAQAVTWAAESFEKGGRLFYMGAGTSGRLGVLDAAECPPTFGVPKEMVVGLIAGGEKAFIEAVEGAEDSRELAVEDLKAHGLTANDFVVGIAASGRTPYVLGGLDYAKSVGCHTAAIACNIGSAIGKAAELAKNTGCFCAECGSHIPYRLIGGGNGSDSGFQRGHHVLFISNKAAGEHRHFGGSAHPAQDLGHGAGQQVQTVRQIWRNLIQAFQCDGIQQEYP